MPLSTDDRATLHKFVRDVVDTLPPRAAKAAQIGRITGEPKADTPPLGDSSERIATTAFVDSLDGLFKSFLTIRTAPTTWTPDRSTGTYQRLELTGASGTITIAEPTNPPPDGKGGILFLEVTVP